jgi:hypothetical protein
MSTRSANRYTSYSKLVSRDRSGLRNIYDKSILGAVNARAKPPFYIKWLMVGGGGEGGAAAGGGGGGGGIIFGIHYLSPTGNLSYGSTYPIGIGGGGGYASQGAGGNGGSTTFLGLTAQGGGGGGGTNPTGNVNARSAGTGGGEPNSLYHASSGTQGGMGGVRFIVDTSNAGAPVGFSPYGFGTRNDNQPGGGDRNGRSGDDDRWFDSNPVTNLMKNIDPAYAAPGPLQFRGFGGGGGGAAGYAAPFGSETSNGAGEGGGGGGGTAAGFESNFLTPTNPVSGLIWGLGKGGGGCSYGYEQNNPEGYPGPTQPSGYPTSQGGMRTGFGSIRDAGDSWTGAPNWSPNGDGIGYNPTRGNPGEPWHNGPAGGFPPAGNAFRPYGWKSGFGEDVSAGGPATLPFTTPAGYHSMNGLPNSGQGGGGRWNGANYFSWGARGPFWGSDSDNPGAPNWLGRAGANTGGKGGSGVLFITYPQVFGNLTSSGSPDVHITPAGFRIYTFRSGGSITIDYDPN